VFGADRDTRHAIKHAADDYGLDFGKLGSGPAPQLEAIEKVPRIRVFTSLGNPPTGSTQPFPRIDQSVWVLRQLGFEADPTNTAALNTSATDPLAGYDLIFNAASGYPADTPANATARNRLAAFFAGGGGYLGGQFAGASFLSTGNQVTGLTAAFNSGVTNPNGTQQGNGYSGILFWDNTGGVNSVITGNYPARDTLIADPPTWLTSVPATWTVDARLPASGFFAAGLWPNNGATTAPGAAVIAHGTNTGNTARIGLFANNPLYRADPEREWPMVATAAYWADN
jgi:hypothetical protein